MEWMWLIGSLGIVALILTGSWLCQWGQRHGKRGLLWSGLRVFVALQGVLDALPGDREQVELASQDRGTTRSARTRSKPKRGPHPRR